MGHAWICGLCFDLVVCSRCTFLGGGRRGLLDLLEGGDQDTPEYSCIARTIRGFSTTCEGEVSQMTMCILFYFVIGFRNMWTRGKNKKKVTFAVGTAGSREGRKKPWHGHNLPKAIGNQTLIIVRLFFSLFFPDGNLCDGDHAAISYTVGYICLS